MKRYEMTEGGAYEQIEAENIDEALSQAIDWARDGEWYTGGGNVYVDVQVWEIDEDGDRIDDGEESSDTIVIEQPAPECLNGEEHEWRAPIEVVGGTEENPGAWGHGGGVIINECCIRCGCKMVTDTWATNPSNGTQGHIETTYEDEGYADEVDALQLQTAIDHLSAKPGSTIGADYDYVAIVGEETRGFDRDEMTAFGLWLLLDDEADASGVGHPVEFVED